MDIVYLVLFMFSLYFISRVFTNPYVNDKSSPISRVRIKTFLNIFGAPIIFGLSCLFIYFANLKQVSIIFYLGLIAGSLIRILLSTRKYLISYTTGASSLEIKYLTSLLKQKTYNISISEVAEIEIVKHNWFSDSPASLNLKQGKDWIGFYLVDKKLTEIVENQVDITDEYLRNTDTTVVTTKH